MLPRRTLGVEQTGEHQVEHTTVDRRPLFALAVFMLFTISALIATEITR